MWSQSVQTAQIRILKKEHDTSKGKVNWPNRMFTFVGLPWQHATFITVQSAPNATLFRIDFYSVQDEFLIEADL